MICVCFFCRYGQAHPVTHRSSYEITGGVRVAESLDPADRRTIRACSTCGHIEEM